MAQNYEAFISYAHEDSAVSKKVHRALEGFRIPRGLRQQAGRDRIGKLFRDTDELATSSSLGATITEALENSRYLIVICTPNTKKSDWVQKEIETFVEKHGRDHVLAVLADGEPETSFPDVLHREKRELDDGAVEWIELEPLAADMRKSKRHPFRTEILRLAAPLIGCSFDDLAQREARRRRMALTAAGCTCGVAIAGLSWIAWSNFQELRRAESEQLAAKSLEAMDDHDRMGAIQLAMEALPSGSGSPLDRPFVNEAQHALGTALNVYPTENTSWETLYGAKVNGPVLQLEVSPDGSWFAARDASSCISIFDTKTGVKKVDFTPTYNEVKKTHVGSWNPLPRLTSFKADVATGNLLVADDVVATSFGYFDFACYDVKSGKILWSLLDSFPQSYSTSSDGNQIAIFSSDFGASLKQGDQLIICDAKTGTQLSIIDLGTNLTGPKVGIPAFSPDNSKVIIPADDMLIVVDLNTGLVQQIDSKTSWNTRIKIDESGFVCAGESSADEEQAIVCRVDMETYETTWSTVISCPAAKNDTGEYVVEEQFEIYPIQLKTERRLYFIIGKTSIAVLEAATGKVFHETPFGLSIIHSLRISKDPLFDISFANGGRWRILVNTNGAVRATNLQNDIDSIYNSRITLVGDEEYQVSVRQDASNVLTVQKPCKARELSKYHEVESSPKMIGKPNCDSSLIACPSFDGEAIASISILDGSTFKHVNTIDVSALDLSVDPKRITYYSFASQDPGTIQLQSTDDDGVRCSLHALDARTGKLIAERTGDSKIDESQITKISWPLAGRNAIVTSFESTDHKDNYTRGAKHIEVVDERTLQPINSFTIDNDIRELNARDVALVLPLKNRVLVLFKRYAPGEKTLFLYDAEKGETIDSDIENYNLTADSGAVESVALSPDSSFFVIPCLDSKLRAFSCKDGSLLWETTLSYSSESTSVYFSPAGNRLVVLDVLGTLSLIDTENGEVLDTYDGLRNITNPLFTENGLFAFSSIQLSSSPNTNDVKMFVIDLSSDRLETRDIIPHAYYMTRDTHRILCLDYFSFSNYSLPYYSYEELLDYAKDVIKGHELTDEERRLYGLK